MSNLIQPIKSFDEILLDEISKVVGNKTKADILKNKIISLLLDHKLVRTVASADLANEILENYGHAVLIRVSDLDPVTELMFEPATVSNVTAFNKAEKEEERQKQIKDIFGNYITK
jgi:hypothetical protein